MSTEDPKELRDALNACAIEAHELREEREALRAILQDIATLWPGNAGCDFETTTAAQLALLVRDGVRGDRETITNRAALRNVGTLATTALRTIIADADTQAAMDIEAGVLHGPGARKVFAILRDVVRPFSEALAGELATPKTEKARVRE